MKTKIKLLLNDDTNQKKIFVKKPRMLVVLRLTGASPQWDSSY